MAIQRVASEHVADITVSVVPLPNEEMKGRIIGRSGRNIRAFEMAAGVDVVVDDTPEAVTVSSFDSVRREIARRAMAKLIVDGRIHPARIEKVIKDAQKEVEKDIKEAGEAAAYEANVHGLHPEILKMLGRLKYRTSYGQNQLHHAVEASKIASVLASELGANVNMAKMGGLLHAPARRRAPRGGRPSRSPAAWAASWWRWSGRPPTSGSWCAGPTGPAIRTSRGRSTTSTSGPRPWRASSCACSCSGRAWPG
jgi:hypothetical protein